MLLLARGGRRLVEEEKNRDYNLSWLYSRSFQKGREEIDKGENLDMDLVNCSLKFLFCFVERCLIGRLTALRESRRISPLAY